MERYELKQNRGESLPVSCIYIHARARTISAETEAFASFQAGEGESDHSHLLEELSIQVNNTLLLFS